MSSLNTGVASDALTLARAAIGRINATTSTSSLIDVAKPALVQPLLMVDADVMHWEGLNEAVQTMHGLFAGFYMQAIDRIGNVANVKAIEKLAPLNPQRDPGYVDMIKSSMGIESYAHRLPGARRLGLESLGLGLESIGDIESIRDDLADAANQERLASTSTAASGTGKVNDMILDAGNLCIGKLFDIKMCVTTGQGKDAVTREANIKVAIRLLTQYMSSQNLAGVLGHSDVSNSSLTERWHKYRSGQISFWRDLVMCMDLIENDRNLMIKDTSGVFQEINDRKGAHATAGLVTGMPSLAAASNLAILSKETLEMIEHKVGAPFKSPRGRKAVFDQTGLMIVMVVNKGYDTVQIYYRGIDLPTVASVRDMKGSNKSGGPDIVEMMKAFITGHNPAL